MVAKIVPHYISCRVRHYKTIELSSPQEEDESPEQDSHDMDLMNDPAFKEIIEKLSPDKPDRPPPPVSVKQC